MKLKKAKTQRVSSYDKSGRNNDAWNIEPHQTRVLADIEGPGLITHIWMTTGNHYREVLLRFTWDDGEGPSIVVPYGDFFGLGNSIVNSYQSLFFSASTANNNQFNKGCALNCYLPMPFRKRALIELINDSDETHRQYFYVDYEKYEDEKELGEEWGYLHAEFHRENPFGGWGHEIRVNSAEADIINKEMTAWENNLVILETKGRGHYIGCNYSVTNFQGTWWGEGDDMIWVDGYKWPPDLHGTGSEDYLNQAWGMQDNAFLRNGSSVFERNTGGYQTSYIFHVENPVRFEREIKVTIEFGQGNHLRNECSTVAYWYADKPCKVIEPPAINKRMPVLKINGKWVADPNKQITSHEVPINKEMTLMKERWKQKYFPMYHYSIGELTIDEENILCMKTKLTRDNPNLYDVPMTDILEEYDGEGIILELVKGTAIRSDGNISTPDINKLSQLTDIKTIASGNLSVKEDGLHIISGENDVFLKELIKDYIGKIAEFEILQIFDEKLIIMNLKYKLQIRVDY